MPLVVADLVAKLGLDKSGFDRGMDGMHQNLGQVGQKMAGAGRAMSMGLTLPLLGVAALSVKSAASFETSMNQIQAASGASATELKGLSDYAKEMGAATVFSAGEAGAAMLELAKAGFTAAQIKAGSLKATMDLAAAGGLELADAATITSNAMNTFGLAAEDASTIAAALAGGANASSADVSDLALALSQVGPGAKTAGLSMQETVAVLSEFADKGIRGQDAGTSLKTMLTNLVPSTDKAAKTFKELGISFTNADGSFKSIAEISQILQDKMGGLSAEQRTLAMNTMFGSDATRAATILMEGGSKAIDKYTEATSNQSAATDMAKARMKGMGGALENMKGSLETAAITIGEILAPGVKAAAGGIMAVANGLNAMPGWAQKAAVGLGTFLVALGPVLLVAGKLATALNAIRQFRMAKQGLDTVTGVLGKGGGVAGNVPLQTALGLNTTATEANTLALGGKGLVPGAGGKPVATPLGAPGGTAGTVGMGFIRTVAAIAVPIAVGITAGEIVYANRPARTPLGEASASGLVNPRSGTIMTPERIALFRKNGEQAGDALADGISTRGASIARSLRASGDKAGAGLAAGLAHGVGPALQSIQHVRDSAGRPIRMGHLDATQMLNEIDRVSAALGGMRGAARTAGNAAANAIRSPSGGGGSYRGHFMAAGGYVPARPGGTTVTLGEGGEGETVIPDSKMGRGGTVLNINVANVHGTDRAAATKLANMAGEIFMQQVRFA